ncbi:MAG: ATP-dependent Clp protease proteolytic subunit, partial [Muribaculaceae bacterium]|nr:ATP-dependent Clp protease proteolytic subunit [Muribaculaceae bacterium]
MKNDFRNYAVNHLGMSSNTLDSYARFMEKNYSMATDHRSIAPSADYLNPYILEERQLNVTQMDVFSRLMMDRIIFMGTQVTDQSANIIQAQLLYLDSVDPEKDISLYINSPGGSVY